jgi:hypothetical protein
MPRTIAHLAPTLALALAPASAESLGPAIDMKPGQEIAIPVTIADGKATPGPARALRPGANEPRDGEIIVGVSSWVFRATPS